ncbi:MAG TPA: hypothetical protein VFG83_03820 [Kofleriaceae bacterium]|nr:hypothetical protein [Kofleriaceae bacterium]
MKAQVLAHIFSAAGGSKDGSRLQAPEGEPMTAYITLGQEALIIDRVVEIDLADEVATIVTAKKERYFVPIDDVRALRVGTSGHGAGYA